MSVGLRRVLCARGCQLLLAMGYRWTGRRFAGDILLQCRRGIGIRLLGVSGRRVGSLRFVCREWVFCGWRFHVDHGTAGGDTDQLRAGGAGDVFSRMLDVALNMLAAGWTVKFKIAHNFNNFYR